MKTYKLADKFEDLFKILNYIKKLYLGAIYLTNLGSI